jgi:uncharacterized protein (DUF4415 family)
MKQEYDFSKGRRGPVVAQKGKTRITIYLDNEVIEAFRTRAESEGSGYQTMINQALKEYLSRRNDLIDEATLRRVIREELQTVGQ